MLGSGNVTVNTGTGSLPQQVKDIVVSASFNWANGSSLTLDAYRSVTVSAPVAVNGSGAVSLVTDDGGSAGALSFIAGGSVSFLGTANHLSVNGAAYVLENSVSTLASAIAANASGNYALANNYDASRDRTYQDSPIPTPFAGNFEGLGNMISNLSIHGTGNINNFVGFFARIQPGFVENVRLQSIKIGGKGFVVGGLAGASNGTISGSFVSGAANSSFHTGGFPNIGLLVGVSNGAITRSGAVGTITTEKEGGVGGLLGTNAGSVTQSYANCTIALGNGQNGEAGGLVDDNDGTISQSYAMGSIDIGKRTDLGGLVAKSALVSTISQSYSTTALRKVDAMRGGFIGQDSSSPDGNSSDYWDTTTSNERSLRRGAGNIKDDPGITGLTTTQLQSGLPTGFDPTIWAESPSINNGFPYLIANPPQ
jgi:hypothetical protein